MTVEKWITQWRKDATEAIATAIEAEAKQLFITAASEHARAQALRDCASDLEADADTPDDATAVVDEAKVLNAAEAHERLRALLLQHFPKEPVDQLASAVAYELVSLIATNAPTQWQALALLLTYYNVGRDQICRLGVGKPHP